jgi:hypothetical protein
MSMPDASANPLADAPVQDDLAGRHTPRAEANARLTSLAGTVLLVLLAVEGITILGITVLGHRLLTAHIVVGLGLLGPLAVKLMSTSWRFLRYYAGDADYGRAGPPRPLLRMLAPVIVVTTIVVFGSGIGLLTVRPGGGSTLAFIHKVSFVLWFGAMTVHVLAYIVPAARRSLADLAGRGPASVLATRRLRQLVVFVSMVAGLGLAIAGLGWAHPWVTWFGTGRARDH